MISGWLRPLATGLQFLTRLPVPGGASANPASFESNLPRTLALFPLIGATIGAATALVLWLAARIWPFPLAVLVALAAEVLLTGGLHEDAVADVCDAFGGAVTREDTLRILKDSRIGSYGLLGLGFALALRAGGLMVIGGPVRAALALVVSGLLGRLAILALLTWVPPLASRTGLAASMAGQRAWPVAWHGAALSAPVLAAAAIATPWALASGVLACAVFVAGFGALVRRRLGGCTGDCLGCAAYAGIVLVTLAYAARP